MKEQGERINFIIQPELLGKLKRQAEKEYTTFSEIIRKAIMGYLKENEKNN